MGFTSSSFAAIAGARRSVSAEEANNALQPAVAWGRYHCCPPRSPALRKRTQVAPCAAGTPWLGMVVFPDHIRVKARKVRHATRRLGDLYEAMRAGDISFGEFDASVQGWINRVRQADSWGLRAHVLAPFELPPGAAPAYAGRRRR